MTSKTTVNMVVGLLGLALLACIAGAIALTATQNTVPDQLWTIGATALGSLASVLVSLRSGEAGTAQPVNVVNPEADPVNVAEAP